MALQICRLDSDSDTDIAVKNSLLQSTPKAEIIFFTTLQVTLTDDSFHSAAGGGRSPKISSQAISAVIRVKRPVLPQGGSAALSVMQISGGCSPAVMQSITTTACVSEVPCTDETCAAGPAGRWQGGRPQEFCL